MSEPFIGEIRIFAGNFAPRGWAFCDGQLLPIASNTALFSLIGTTYGGDGETTMALPDLQGRAPMHSGFGPGLTSRRLGQRGGVSTVTLSEAQMPSHTHTMQGSLQYGDDNDPGGQYLARAVGAFPVRVSEQPRLDGVASASEHGGEAKRTTTFSPTWSSTSSLLSSGSTRASKRLEALRQLFVLGGAPDAAAVERRRRKAMGRRQSSTGGRRWFQ